MATSKIRNEPSEIDEPLTVGLKVRAKSKYSTLTPRLGKIVAVRDGYYLLDVIEPYKGKNRKFHKSEYDFSRV